MGIHGFFYFAIITIALMVLTDVFFMISTLHHRQSILALVCSGIAFCAFFTLILMQERTPALLSITLPNLSLVLSFVFLGVSHHFVLDKRLPKLFYIGIAAISFVLSIVYVVVEAPYRVRLFSTGGTIIVLSIYHSILLLRERKILGGPISALGAGSLLFLPLGVGIAVNEVLVTENTFSHFVSTNQAVTVLIMFFILFLMVHLTSYIVFYRLSNKEFEKAIGEVTTQRDLGRTIALLVGHDLRTPLSVILQAAELLDEDCPHADIISLIRNTTGKALYIVQDLILWGHSKKEDFQLKPAPVRLRDCVEETWGGLAFDGNAKNLQFILTIPHETTVNVDENAFRAVVRNLLSNAIKFSRSGSVISVGTAALNNNDDSIRLEIRDEGIGMSPEQLERYKSGTNKTSREGTNAETGLGIAGQLIVFISRNAGWNLDVSSKPNSGTTATLDLPAVMNKSPN